MLSCAGVGGGFPETKIVGLRVSAVRNQTNMGQAISILQATKKPVKSKILSAKPNAQEIPMIRRGRSIQSITSRVIRAKRVYHSARRVVLDVYVLLVFMVGGFAEGWNDLWERVAGVINHVYGGSSKVRERLMHARRLLMACKVLHEKAYECVLCGGLGVMPTHLPADYFLMCDRLLSNRAKTELLSLDKVVIAFGACLDARLRGREYQTGLKVLELVARRQDVLGELATRLIGILDWFAESLACVSP